MARTWAGSVQWHDRVSRSISLVLRKKFCQYRFTPFFSFALSLFVQKTEACRPANNDLFSSTPEPHEHFHRGTIHTLPSDAGVTAGEVETKVSVERSIPDRSSKSSLAPATSASPPYSGARLTHPSAVLPPKLKFYGTSEYKAQFTNKGIITSPAGGGRPEREANYPSSHPYSQLQQSQLTTKKLREQSLTEQRSKYIWPADYLFKQQHEIRPKRSTGESSTTISAGELITSAGREEMKSLEPCDKKSLREEGTQKSLIELDSIGSHLRDDSNFSSSSSSSSHFNQQTNTEKWAPWTPTQNLHSHTSIEKLGMDSHLNAYSSPHRYIFRLAGIIRRN